MSKTVTVTKDQRLNAKGSEGIYDAVVASKGDVLKIKRHGIINKEEYIELPNICIPNRILLNSAIKDGWVRVNN